jgi:NAD(P)-dependent dehydrogenase (short-subunit alcohol dehydrogenase family)/acyl carrier protein
MDDGAEPADDFAAPGRADGCLSILYLVQALDRIGGAGSARLWVGTSGAQAACEGTTTASVAQAPAWGLGRVVAQEFPSSGCTLIDLAGEAPEADAEALLADLTSGSGESQIAWRGGRRYVARLARRSPRFGREAAVDPAATYLVTGGAGGLGLRVARRLVERGALNLLLVGRSGLAPEARAAVAELEARGARVVFAAADTADAGQLARVLSEARATLPALKGVVHAAGVVDDAPLRELDAGRLARVLAPKVSGGWNLHRLTLDAELDFFVLFSSLSSVFGNAGQGNYAAGNAFLDALAHYRRSSGLPALSINWGPWAETGMAAGHAATLARRGVGGIRPDEGLAVLESLLGGDDAQVIASPFEWAGFAAHYTRLAAEPFMREVVGDGEALKPAADETATPARGSALAARLAAALPAEAASILVGHIQDVVCGVLGLPASHRPDATQGFFELGMDSLMLAELHRRLAADTGASFPLSALFDHGNAEALARYVAAQVAPAAARDEAAPAADEQDINLALDELERLSDEEAFALLAGKLGMDGAL